MAPPMKFFKEEMTLNLSSSVIFFFFCIGGDDSSLSLSIGCNDIKIASEYILD